MAEKAKNKVMNESEVVKDMSKRTGLSLKASHSALTAFAGVVADALGKHVDVRVPLGKFKSSYRKERTGRNPQTGKPLKIAARRVPSFHASAPLKRATNK